MPDPTPRAPRGASKPGEAHTVALRLKPTSPRSRVVIAVAVLLALVTTALGTLGNGEPASAATQSSAPRQARGFYYTIWPSSASPEHPAGGGSASIEVGTRFTTNITGWATAVRFYKGAQNTGTHVGTLWDSSGRALAKATFTGETTSGWQKARFSNPVALKPGVSYVVSYRAPKGRHAVDQYALSPTKPKLRYALKATQGVYTYGTGMPAQTSRNSNYYVDVVFTTTAPSTSTPTATSSTTTAPTATSSTTTAPTATAGRVLYGVNPGGWRTLGQTPLEAYNAATSAYGHLGFMRLWPSRFNTQWRGGLIPTYVYDAKIPVYINLGSDVAGVNAGSHDAEWIQILKTAPTDRQIWFSFAHEPENDGFTVAAWQQAQMRLANIKARYAPANVKFAPLLMGASFHPTRYKVAASGNVPWSTWFNFDLTNVDAIGADLYQWGTDDASADAASTVVNPALSAAALKGKRLIVGELGARNTLTDAGRAKFLKDAVNLFNADKNVTAVAYFESDNGAKGPWNLLPKPADKSWNYPLSIATWKAAVQSSPAS